MQTLSPTDKDYWKQIVASSNQLGVRLLPSLQGPGSASNVVISPTSIFVLLSMLYNGACGNTYVELAQSLGLPSDKELNPWMRQLINFINGHTQPELDVQLVSALWFGAHEALHFDFANAMTEVYSASLYGVDFAQRDACARINSWAANATRGNINSLLDEIPPNTRFVLTNAIYFLGKWEHEFKAGASSSDFYVTGGGAKKFNAMHTSNAFAYFEDAECQSILLPYKHGNYAMHIAIPRKVQSPNVLLPRIDELIARTSASGRPLVELSMPKFEISFSLELQRMLGNMGIRDLSDPASCDLGRIGNSLVASKIIHKATIKVNELGSEASAATAALLTFGGLPQPPQVVMNVDHSFVYSICDVVTGQVLFIGTYCEP